MWSLHGWSCILDTYLLLPLPSDWVAVCIPILHNPIAAAGVHGAGWQSTWGLGLWILTTTNPFGPIQLPPREHGQLKYTYHQTQLLYSLGSEECSKPKSECYLCSCLKAARAGAASALKHPFAIYGLGSWEPGQHRGRQGSCNRIFLPWERDVAGLRLQNGRSGVRAKSSLLLSACVFGPKGNIALLPDLKLRAPV